MSPVYRGFFCAISFIFVVFSVKTVLVSLCMLLAVQLYGQGGLFLHKRDTVRISSRTGGKELDSLPDYYNGTQMLTPGGFPYGLFGRYNASYEGFMQRFSSPFPEFENGPFYFSAVPHLGFAYSFGSKSLQQLHVDYQQFFSKKFGINLDYNRSSIGNMMRDGSYKHNDFRFQTRYLSKRYKNFNRFYFYKSEIRQNGGLDTAQSVLEFPLDFLKVRKDAALTMTENFRAEAEHYVNFLGDSLRDLGLVVENLWTISNRVYTESDSLHLVYDEINIDSLNTRDQFQFSRLRNSVGAYANTKNFFGQLALFHAYWDYQNLGAHRDTSEFGLHAALRYRSGNFQLSNRSYYNLAGAVGEKSSAFQFLLERPAHTVSAVLEYREKLPDLQQRSYFANNFSWNLGDLRTQKFLLAGADLKLKKGKTEYLAQLRFQHYGDHYFFVDSIWRNDTLKSLQLLNIRLKADFRYKILIIQPMVIFNRFSEGLDFLPVIDLRVRLGVQKKIFKSQKLDFLAGVDLGYQSSRSLPAYLNALDIFVLSASEEKSNPQLYKIDVFAGFQIESFRFYVRAENVDYLWNKSDSFIAQQVPVTPFYLRLGLTWDFFN